MMFNWIKRLFRKEPEPIDPIGQMIAERAFQTGNIVIGNLSPTGELEIEEYPVDYGDPAID